MIRLGINENVKIGSGTEVTDKGLTFNFVRGTSSTFDAFVNDGDIEDSINIFLPTIFVLEFGKTTPRDPKAIAKDVKRNVSYMKSILGIYLKLEEVDKYLGGGALAKLFAKYGATAENLDSKWTDEKFVNGFMMDCSKAFVKAIADHKLTTRPELFRIKLPRQSKNNFAALPLSIYTPWIESMDVEKSAIEWSDYEIQHKLDRMIDIATDPTAPAEVKTAETLFGDNGQNTTPANDVTINEIFPEPKKE